MSSPKPLIDSPVVFCIRFTLVQMSGCARTRVSDAGKRLHNDLSLQLTSKQFVSAARLFDARRKSCALNLLATRR
jgi:hypothetical protein